MPPATGSHLNDHLQPMCEVAENFTLSSNAAQPYVPLESLSDGDKEPMLGEVLNAPPTKGNACVQPLLRCLSRVIPPGGMLSTVFNMSSACIGAGILGVPAAANSSGLAMAFLYPAVIMIFSLYSLFCLTTLMERLDVRSYEGMANALLGPALKHVTSAMRLVTTFGACVAYIISVGNIFSAIIEDTDAPGFWKSRSGNRLLTGLVWLVVMLPLVIPKHINSLRYVSMVGVGFIVYFVLLTIVHSCMNGLLENVQNINVVGDATDEGIHMFGTGNRALDGLGVFMFAFMCHLNSFEMYWDMTHRNASRFTLYSGIALIFCFFAYFLTSVFGYLDFGSRVTDSILLMYDPVKKPVVMVAYIGILVKLCASYALNALVSRNTIYYAVGWDVDSVPFWKHCVIVIVLSSVMLLCGLFIPKINTVFGFVGAVCGGLTSFIFPAIFMMYAGNWTLRSVGWTHYTLTYALLVVGVICLVFGTGSAIYSVVVPQ
ncbi:putative amino acid transporter PAT1 [Trypanosoma grayi]|uniref:putative amino acid transporter PAT1 n=1 Tax=Trypanosoma grayi TaxID=71804 RepID=UPI0004F41A6F|nr:putative amino acid transporter PAT1 [Trypanosoma grayi]KEG06524.1 putative amino acid transporter PAT1 [Trypanosoma grayi]